MAGVMNGVVIGVRAISSRSSGIGRRDTCRRVACVGAGLFLHPFRDMDPDELTNIFSLLAFE